MVHIEELPEPDPYVFTASYPLRDLTTPNTPISLKTMCRRDTPTDDQYLSPSCLLSVVISEATSLAEQVYVHRVHPLWPMQGGGSLRVIQAGSDDGPSDLKLQIDGAR